MSTKKKPDAADPERVKVSLYIPPSVWKAIQHLAIDRDTSAQDLVRDALEAILKSAKKGARDAR